MGLASIAEIGERSKLGGLESNGAPMTAQDRDPSDDDPLGTVLGRLTIAVTSIVSQLGYRNILTPIAVKRIFVGWPFDDDPRTIATHRKIVAICVAHRKKHRVPIRAKQLRGRRN